MIWRDFREQDLVDCLSVEPARIGAELVGVPRAIAVWKKLIRHRSFNAAIMETDPPIAGHRIVGFGASVFVSPRFAEEEIASPGPGLNARIVASIDAGGSAVLAEAALRSGNTHGGLSLVILYASPRAGILGTEGISEVDMLLASSLLEHHRGYRINRIIVELFGETDRSRAESNHVWRIVGTFEPSRLQYPGGEWGRDRAIAVMQRDEALSVPGSVVTVLFHHREPILRLRDCDQQLLTAALKGSTDEELSRELNVRLATVKRRWITLFERIAEIRPGLFPIGTYDVDRRKRGRQKRHYLLAYVREHPEELRPIEHPQARLDRRGTSRGTAPGSAARFLF